MTARPLVVAACALIPLALAGCAATPAPDPLATGSVSADTGPHHALNERIAYYAELYDVPESVIHRSVQRESGYNPNQHAGPYWGLMQIRVDTARGMGYRGPPRGLLDPDTNLKYAVAYLANAYMVAGGDENRALALYAGGYFYEARRKHMQDRLRTAASAPAAELAATSDP